MVKTMLNAKPAPPTLDRTAHDAMVIAIGRAEVVKLQNDPDFAPKFQGMTSAMEDYERDKKRDAFNRRKEQEERKRQQEDQKQKEEEQRDVEADAEIQKRQEAYKAKNAKGHAELSSSTH